MNIVEMLYVFSFGARGAALQWFDVPEPPHFDNPGARK